MTSAILINRVQWCHKHWSPYRLGFARGLMATCLMVQRLLEDEAFMRQCGFDPATGCLADVERINAEIPRINPLCCRLGDPVMDMILVQTLHPSKNLKHL